MAGEMNRFLERLPLARKKPWLAYGITLLVAAVALAARFALDPFMPSGFPYVTFFPAVILSSFLFGRGPGILAGTLCGLAAWYFFIPPYGTLALFDGNWVAIALYVGIVAVDITVIHWMQRANIRLRTERERSEGLAAHAELLFHELQHRVSNNLQMVGAVLSMQRRSIADPKAVQALGDAATKLQAIGRIQRQLYRQDGAHLALDRFLPDLVRDLIDASGQPGIACAVEVASDLKLPPHAAVPVALIMAEAVANAVEHGFADRAAGSIRVNVVQDECWLTLSVVDDGAGPPAGFDAATSNSLGLRITRTLAEQLGGSFSLVSNAPRGSIAQLRFPIDAPALTDETIG